MAERCQGGLLAAKCQAWQHSGGIAMRSLTAFAGLVLASFGVVGPCLAQLSKAPVHVSQRPVKAETFAGGLVHPWGLAFLPDGRLLVTERPGRLRIVDRQGELSAPISGVPEVYASGQGGLLDVAVAPDFATSQLVYLSFAEPRAGGKNGTSVARGTLVASGS